MKKVETSFILCCALCLCGSVAPTQALRPPTSRRRSWGSQASESEHSSFLTHSRLTRGTQEDEFDRHAAEQNHALTFASSPLGGNSAFRLGPSPSVFGGLPSYANGRGITYNGGINSGVDSFLPNFGFPNFGNFPQFGNGPPGKTKAYIPPVAKVLKEGINAFVPAGAQKYVDPVPFDDSASPSKQTLPLLLPKEPPIIRLPQAQKPSGNTNQFDVFRQVAVNPLQKAFSASISDPSLSPLSYPEEDISKEKTIQLIKRVEQDLLQVEKSLTPEERKTKEIYEAIDGITPSTKLVQEVVTVPTIPRIKIHETETVGRQNTGPENYVSHDGFPIQNDSKLSPFQPTSSAAGIPHKHIKEVEHSRSGDPEQPYAFSATQPAKTQRNFNQKNVENPSEHYFDKTTSSKPNVRLESEPFIRPGSNRGEFYPLNSYEETSPYQNPKSSEPIDSISYENANARTFRQEPHIVETSIAGAQKPNDGILSYSSAEFASSNRDTRKKLQPIEYKQFAYEDGIQSSELDPHSRVLQSFGLRPLPKPPQVEPSELFSGAELLTLVQKSNPVTPGIPAEKLLAIASTTVNSIESHNPAAVRNTDYHLTSSLERPHRVQKNSSTRGLQTNPFAGRGERRSSTPFVPYGSRTSSYHEGAHLNQQVSEILNSHEIPTNVSHTKVWLHHDKRNSSRVPHNSNSYNYAPKYQVRKYIDSQQFSGINKTSITPTDPSRGRITKPFAAGNLQSSNRHFIRPNTEQITQPPEAGLPKIHEGRLTQPPGHIFQQSPISSTDQQPKGRVAQASDGRSIQKPEGHLSQPPGGLIQPHRKHFDQPLHTAKIHPADLKTFHNAQITFERPPLQSSIEIKHHHEVKSKEKNARLSTSHTKTFDGREAQEAPQLGSKVLLHISSSTINTRNKTGSITKNVRADSVPSETDITSYLLPRQENNGRRSSVPESFIPDFNSKSDYNPISVSSPTVGSETESQLGRPIEDFHNYGTVLEFNSAGHSKEKLSFKTETPKQIYESETGKHFYSRSHENNIAKTYDSEQQGTLDEAPPKNFAFSPEHSSFRNIHEITTVSHEFNHKDNIGFSPRYQQNGEKNINLQHQSESTFSNPKSNAQEFSPKLKVSPEIYKLLPSSEPSLLTQEKSSHLLNAKELPATVAEPVVHHTSQALFFQRYNKTVPQPGSYDVNNGKYATPTTQHESHDMYEEQYIAANTKHFSHDLSGKQFTAEPHDHIPHNLNEEKHIATLTQYALQDFNGEKNTYVTAPTQHISYHLEEETYAATPKSHHQHVPQNWKVEKPTPVHQQYTTPDLNNGKYTATPNSPRDVLGRTYKETESLELPRALNGVSATTAATQYSYTLGEEYRTVASKHTPPSSNTKEFLKSGELHGSDIATFVTSLEKPSIIQYSQDESFSDQVIKQGQESDVRAFDTQHMPELSLPYSSVQPTPFKNQHSTVLHPNKQEHDPSVQALSSLRNVHDVEDNLQQFVDNRNGAHQFSSTVLEPYFSSEGTSR